MDMSKSDASFWYDQVSSSLLDERKERVLSARTEYSQKGALSRYAAAKSVTFCSATTSYVAL